MPVPPAFDRFLRLYGAGDYWESHEALEATWRENRSGFYHGLILFASAFVHVERGNPHGIDAQLRKTIDALEAYRPHYMGIDVDAVISYAERGRAVVARHRSLDSPDWPELIPAPPLAVDPDLLHGDEPELRERPGSR